MSDDNQIKRVADGLNRTTTHTSVDVAITVKPDGWDVLPDVVNIRIQRPARSADVGIFLEPHDALYVAELIQKAALEIIAKRDAASSAAPDSS